MQIHISFDHQIFGWQKYGGISRYMYELACALAVDHEQNVTVVAPIHVNQYILNAPKKLTVIGRSVKQLPRTGRILRALNHLIVRRLFKQLKPDIVHETYYSRSRTSPQNTKVVLTVFDLIHERFPQFFSSIDPTHKEKAAAVARADHIICISHQTKNDLIEFLQINPSKITVVHLGFSMTTDKIELSDLTKGSPYLFYVGNRGGHKNFINFLRAVALSIELKEKYRIICFGGGTFSATEQEQIKFLGFSDNQVLQLSGSDAVLAGLYKHATAFIFPSLYEGFGIPPLEAMSYDCPVVCSNTSSIPEVVGDAAAYFDPTNIDEMRVVIESVVSDRELMNSLVSRGRRRILEFSWSKCAAETLEVYRKVLACEL